MNPKEGKTIIILALIILFIINYPFLDKLVVDYFDESQNAHVVRIIDGDTVEVELDSGNRTNVRLLGINTPEKNELYYEEAKEFLESQLFNKTVRLEYGKEKYDRYHRLLAYIYMNERNINLEVVKNGLGNYYFPSGKDNHYNDFVEVWESCLNKKINLCEKSEDVCANCVELSSLDVKNQEIVLYNTCGFDCDMKDWEIKDEGRKKFVFPGFVLKPKNYLHIIIGEGENSGNILFWSGEDYVLTKTGDSIFLRDDEKKSILFYTY